jgi:hypothetical protein
VGREPAKRHRSGVRLPVEPVVRQPLEQLPRGRHLVVELRQKGIDDRHRILIELNANGYCAVTT